MKKNKVKDIILSYCQSLTDLSQIQMALLQDLSESLKKQQELYQEMGKIANELEKLTLSEFSE